MSRFRAATRRGDRNFEVLELEKSRPRTRWKLNRTLAFLHIWEKHALDQDMEEAREGRGSEVQAVQLTL